jgi:ribosomal protein S18 acetylase RimI-like enzyme
MIGGYVDNYKGEKVVKKIALFVDSEFRGKGIAQMLMHSVEDWARSLPNIKTLMLQVYKENVPAIRLYKKLGFKVIEELPAAVAKNGVEYDDYLMAKNI